MRCFLSFFITHVFSEPGLLTKLCSSPLAGRLAVGKGLFRGLHLHGFALEHHTFPFHVVFKSHQKFRRTFSHTPRSSAVCASSSDLHVPCKSLLYHPRLAVFLCFFFLMLSITPLICDSCITSRPCTSSVAMLPITPLVHSLRSSVSIVLTVLQSILALFGVCCINQGLGELFWMSCLFFLSCLTKAGRIISFLSKPYIQQQAPRGPGLDAPEILIGLPWTMWTTTHRGEDSCIFLLQSTHYLPKQKLTSMALGLLRRRRMSRLPLLFESRLWLQTAPRARKLSFQPGMYILSLLSMLLANIVYTHSSP